MIVSSVPPLAEPAERASLNAFSTSGVMKSLKRLAVGSSVRALAKASFASGTFFSPPAYTWPNAMYSRPRIFGLQARFVSQACSASLRCSMPSSNLPLM